MVTPETLYPSSVSNMAATDESTPPLMATITFLLIITLQKIKCEVVIDNPRPSHQVRGVFVPSPLMGEG
jgi:hypothetical protein